MNFTNETMTFQEWFKVVYDEVHSVNPSIADDIIEAEARDVYMNSVDALDFADELLETVDWDLYDGQPDEAQEWADFGEVYDDEYPLFDGGEY